MARQACYLAIVCSYRVPTVAQGRTGGSRPVARHCPGTVFPHTGLLMTTSRHTAEQSASTAADTATRGTMSPRQLTRLQRAIVDGLENVKAQDIRVFNTEEQTALFERVIVASGTSSRQTRALAASVRDAVKAAGFAPPRNEGEDNGEWIVVDCGACVVHVMQPAIRQYYRLEEMWGAKPVRVKLGAAKSSRRTASEDASASSQPPAASAASAKPAARKPAARRTTATGSDALASAGQEPAFAPTAARRVRSAAPKTTAEAAVKTGANTASRAAKGTAAAAAKPGKSAKPATASVKTVVIKPVTARGAAKKLGTGKTTTKTTSTPRSRKA